MKSIGGSYGVPGHDANPSFCAPQATYVLPVLPKLAYLALCRSIQLLALLSHCDAAKDLEILVLCHQLTMPYRTPPSSRTAPARGRRPCPARGAQPGTAPLPLVVLVREAPDAAGLAPPPGPGHRPPTARHHPRRHSRSAPKAKDQRSAFELHGFRATPNSGSQDVADADHAFEFAALDDRKMAKPIGQHHIDGLVGRRVGPDCYWVARHPF